MSDISGSCRGSQEAVIPLQNLQKNFTRLLIILSGPEPQRGILKKKLTDILKEKNNTAVILEGRPGIKNEIVKSGNITFYNHLPTSEMKEMLTRERMDNLKGRI